jgi:acetoin utilization protein AcuC
MPVSSGPQLRRAAGNVRPLVPADRHLGTPPATSATAAGPRHVLDAADTLKAMTTPLVIWDPAMLAYDLGGSHPLNPLRWELTWRLAADLGVLDGIGTVAPDPAGDDVLATIHTAEYIDAVKTASGADRNNRVGHGLGTTDNPVFPGMHASAALIAGGSVAAARAVARREVDRAVNIAGGLHHAMADHASGFCVYNDAALAIAALLAEGVERVAYVDVDVHHGDGVQRAFYTDPRVLTVSIHETPLSLWPGTGYVTESGRGDCAGRAVNIPVPAGSGDAAWLRAFTAIVPAVLREFRPDVLVTQHGADSHWDDPLADLNLTVDGQRASYLLLRRLAGETAGGRWVVLGGGGYCLVKAVPRAWTHLLALVADRDLDVTTRIGTEWIAAASAARPATTPPDVMGENGGEPVDVEPWDGQDGTPIDRAIMRVRKEIFPLYGLDPFDPRD